MYIGLRSYDTLHKKFCRRGPGRCRMPMQDAARELPRIPLLGTSVNSLQRKQALGFAGWDDRCEEVKVGPKGVTPQWPKWSLPKTP